MEKIMTTKEFAELHDVDYATASGFLKFLVKKGLVTEAGSRPNPGGKGKPSQLYKIPETVSVAMIALKAA